MEKDKQSKSAKSKKEKVGNRSNRERETERKIETKVKCYLQAAFPILALFLIFIKKHTKPNQMTKTRVLTYLEHRVSAFKYP